MYTVGNSKHLNANMSLFTRRNIHITSILHGSMFLSTILQKIFHVGCPPKKTPMDFWVGFPIHLVLNIINLSSSFGPNMSQLRLGHLPRLDSIEEPTKSMCMELMNIQATALGGNRDGEMREMLIEGLENHGPWIWFGSIPEEVRGFWYFSSTVSRLFYRNCLEELVIDFSLKMCAPRTFG